MVCVGRHWRVLMGASDVWKVAISSLVRSVLGNLPHCADTYLYCSKRAIRCGRRDLSDPLVWNRLLAYSRSFLCTLCLIGRNNAFTVKQKAYSLEIHITSYPRHVGHVAFTNVSLFPKNFTSGCSARWPSTT